MDLASILHISCDECGRINHVNTSDTHQTGTCGPCAFDSNPRAVLATLNTGIGESHLSKILSMLNVPPLSQNTFKRRERGIGKAVEKVAKLS